MSDARGLAYQQRVSTLIGLYGEPFTLVRAGAGTGRVAIFDPMDNSVTGTFFDANESVGLLKPSLTMYLGGDGDMPLVNDVFTRDGRLFTVEKVFYWRVVDVVVYAVAHCD